MKSSYLILYILFFAFTGNTILYGQVEKKEKKEKWRPFKNFKKVLEIPFSGAIFQDTSQLNTDISPLDIASDRGLFILSPDKLMQMRISGSVRAAFNYNSSNLQNKGTLNPYEIPTENNGFVPNFSANLDQTRLGFDVTRRTNFGDLFIRIEADFNNQVNSFRIRHAYGQVGRYLIGQTWSLFSNVSYVPATVSTDGPVGSVFSRNPQIRFSKPVNENLSWHAGIEYSTVDVYNVDSVDVSSVKFLQVIPDFTGRIKYMKDRLSLQVSGIITTISVQNTDQNDDNIDYSFGLGMSTSGVYTLPEDDRVYLSFTMGRSISRYLALFAGNGEDASYDSSDDSYNANISTAGFVAYEKKLPHNLLGNISAGIASIKNKTYQPSNAYNWSYNALLNLFWKPVDGARLGIEYSFGHRYDHRVTDGGAHRFGMLLYYDF